MAKDDFQKRLKDLRKARKMTLEDVANIVGVGKSTVRKWETGMIENLRRDKIASLARALGTTPAFLMGWEEEEEHQQSGIYSLDLSTYGIHSVEKKRFPLLGEIACGQPIYADQYHESYIMANADIDADFCLVAKGDSMIGARINDGDVVFIRKQPVVQNGEIAAVIIEDEATLKRWYYDRDNNRLVLSPENTAYPPIVIVGDELDRVVCLGKAVCFMSKL